MASVHRTNLGTTNVSYDDITTAPTRLFSGQKYTDDYVGYKTIQYRAQHQGGRVYTIEINTNYLEYIDLSKAYITYEFSLKNKGGQVAKHDQIYVVPDIGNAIWDSVSVRINNAEVTDLTMDKVGYQEYIKGLLNLSRAGFYSQCLPRMFLLDGSGFYENETEGFRNYGMHYTVNAEKKYEYEKDANGKLTDEIAGYARGNMTNDDKAKYIMVRHRMCTETDTFQVTTPLPSHLFGIQKALPPNMNIVFTFHPAHPNFYLLSKYKNVNAGLSALEIVNMKLTVGLMELDQRIRLAHEKAFLDRRICMIPFTKLSVRESEFPSGLSRFNWIPFRGICPKVVIAVIMKTLNYRGRLSHSPYVFENCDVQFASLKIGNNLWIALH